MHCYRRNTRSQTWLMVFGWFLSNHPLRHFQQLKIVTSCILVLYKMLPILPRNLNFSLLTTCSSRKLHSSSSGKYRGMRDFPLFTSFGLYPANVDKNLLMFVACYNLQCLPTMVRLTHLYCFLLVSILMWFASVDQS